jgi:hypothetical protein
MIGSIHTDVGSPMGQRLSWRWHRRPVYRYRAKVGELRRLLPRFERRVHGGRYGRDGIVRSSVAHNEDALPVGSVSSDYVLVQHEDLIDALPPVMKKNGFDFDEMVGELNITARGERMELVVELPSVGAIPQDGFPLACRLRCLNSVDATTSVEAELQWYRQICSNGMFGWRGGKAVREIHRFGNVLKRVQHRLQQRFNELQEDRGYFTRLLNTPVTQSQLHEWLHLVVARQWGWHEAVRTHHICQSGRDGVPGLYSQYPYRVPIERPVDVPGACAPVRNAYHVGQALSWIAGLAPTMERRFSQIASIPRLLRYLLN